MQTNTGNDHAGWAEFKIVSPAFAACGPLGFVWSVASRNWISPCLAKDHARHDHEDSRTASSESDLFVSRLRRKWEVRSCLHHIRHVVHLESAQE